MYGPHMRSEERQKGGGGGILAIVLMFAALRFGGEKAFPEAEASSFSMAIQSSSYSEQIDPDLVGTMEQTQDDVDYSSSEVGFDRIPAECLDMAAARPYAEMMNDTAIAWGFSPLMISGIVDTEGYKGFNSPAGAVGIMQVMPSTADYLCQKYDVSSCDVNNPQDNFNLGMLKLYDLRRLGINTEMGLVGYYNGDPNTEENKTYRLRYLQRVAQNAACAGIPNNVTFR